MEYGLIYIFWCIVLVTRILVMRYVCMILMLLINVLSKLCYSKINLMKPAVTTLLPLVSLCNKLIVISPYCCWFAKSLLPPIKNRRWWTWLSPPTLPLKPKTRCVIWDLELAVKMSSNVPTCKSKTEVVSHFPQTPTKLLK